MIYRETEHLYIEVDPTVTDRWTWDIVATPGGFRALTIADGTADTQEEALNAAQAKLHSICTAALEALK